MSELVLFTQSVPTRSLLNKIMKVCSIIYNFSPLTPERNVTVMARSGVKQTWIEYVRSAHHIDYELDVDSFIK